MKTRHAALAGMWYPGREDSCRQEIEAMLANEPDPGATAGIVPHAGWAYSGSLATRVFQAIAAADPTPELLLLFGTHMAPTSPAQISRADAFDTPLGPIQADPELAAALADELGLRPDPADESRGGGDNTVEVQLPLIKYLLPDIKLVVIGPPASKESIEIGRRAVARARERHAHLAVVGSTDLTHYGRRFGFAPKGYGDSAAQWVREDNDARVIQRMLALDPEGVLDEAGAHQNACVPGSVAATLSGAAELGLESAELLEYRNSYELSPSDTFVGYAAVAIRN